MQPSIRECGIELTREVGSMIEPGLGMLTLDWFAQQAAGRAGSQPVKAAEAAPPLDGCKLGIGGSHIGHINGRASIGVQAALQRGDRHRAHIATCARLQREMRRVPRRLAQRSPDRLQPQRAESHV